MRKVHKKNIFLLLKYALGLLILISVSKSSNAQWGGYHSFAADWEFNANLGMTSFYGDLTDNKNRFFSNSPFNRYFYEDRDVIYGFLLKKHFNRWFILRGEFKHGKLQSNPTSYDLHFESKFNSYYLAAELNFTNIFRREGEYNLHIYGFAGLGVTDYRTWLYDDENNKLVERHGYGNSRWFDSKPKMAKAFTIPGGLGITYRFNDNWAMNFETSINLTVTDKLDSYNSNISNVEGYGTTSLGISYYFHLPWNFRFSRYPSYKNRSDEPAIKKYNRKRRVIMKTKSYRKAKRKRHRKTSIIERIIFWFKRRQFTKR